MVGQSESLPMIIPTTGLLSLIVMQRFIGFFAQVKRIAPNISALAEASRDECSGTTEVPDQGWRSIEGRPRQSRTSCWMICS
ncbi:MAG: hypothetical protein BWY82_02739 [Verrucomicrobia bacterium ADurb.Bin474]|nr:MAG: hypothetical protein BWY82_02739 [Verrucomicrobia bacterium ADurb.Bin474]